ncbi:MAG: hypothetical protein R3F43_11400 [bacterium]
MAAAGPTLGAMACRGASGDEAGCGEVVFRAFNAATYQPASGQTTDGAAAGRTGRRVRDLAAHDGTFSALWITRSNIVAVALYREQVLPPVCFDR